MTYTIIRRIPHTSAVGRSYLGYKEKNDAEFTKEMLNLLSPLNLIRYVVRF